MENEKKSSGFWGIFAALVTLASVIILMCVFMKKIRAALTGFWDEIQEKRSNLKVYMD